MRTLRTLGFDHQRRGLAVSVLIILVVALSIAPAGATVISRGTTVRVNLLTGGSQMTGGNSLDPSISGDGRYVAFHTGSESHPDDSNGKVDILVRDNDTGALEIVSVSTGGIQGNEGSWHASISADGRYVIFDSSAPSFVSGDTNGLIDIFVRDRQASTTTRVSVASDGTQAIGGHSRYHNISGGGRYVAFQSYATNLVTGDTNGVPDTFVRDLQTDVTERVSVDSSDQQTNGGSGSNPAISHDGRYVAFSAHDGTLVSGDNNGYSDVFVRDRQSGTTERISMDMNGGQGNEQSGAVGISADGRYVAFRSLASDLVPGDNNSDWDVFRHDRVTGLTQRVSVASDGAESSGGLHWGTVISGNGRYVAFYSEATNLVVGDDNGDNDVFVHDCLKKTTTRVSVTSNELQVVGDSSVPAITSDGSHITFESSAANMVSGDTNGNDDIFLRNWLPDTQDSEAVEGATRYETAIAASQDAFPDGASAVVIATGTNWPDALGGAALAGALNGPILLTRPTALPTSVSDEIDRLGATEAVILGGTGAVSSAVEDALITKLGSGNVTRHGGGNRYSTAELVVQATVDELGDTYGGVAFVSTGLNFPDALAASPLAGFGMPILLSPSSGLTANTKTTMNDIGVSEVLILGGTGAVSAAVETDLNGTFGADNVTRLAGATRYETAVKVAEYGVDSMWLAWNDVALATGANFPDALAGGVLQARSASVMLLTQSSTLTQVTADTLQANKDSIGNMRFLGGTGAISIPVRNEAMQLLN